MEREELVQKISKKTNPLVIGERENKIIKVCLDIVNKLEKKHNNTKELINNAILEATWWENKLTKKQKTKMTMDKARCEVVEAITKKLLKKLNK
jgi:hypothetical protein